MRHSSTSGTARVFLTRGARAALARLDPDRREALRDGLFRVGWQLLARAERVTVEPDWARRTWPHRHYPQQCYAKAVKYVLDHPEIEGLRLIHGVVSHAPHFLPLEHAWVELPGEIVFDGVVQTFFERASYYAVMAAVAVDAYSAGATRGLVAAYRRPGPWNAKWVPTAGQLEAYAAATRDVRSGAPLQARQAAVRTDSRGQAQSQ